MKIVEYCRVRRLGLLLLRYVNIMSFVWFQHYNNRFYLDYSFSEYRNPQNRRQRVNEHNGRDTQTKYYYYSMDCYYIANDCWLAAAVVVLALLNKSCIIAWYCKKIKHRMCCLLNNQHNIT